MSPVISIENIIKNQKYKLKMQLTGLIRKGRLMAQYSDTICRVLKEGEDLSLYRQYIIEFNFNT